MRAVKNLPFWLRLAACCDMSTLNAGFKGYLLIVLYTHRYNLEWRACLAQINACLVLHTWYQVTYQVAVNSKKL